MKAAKPAYSFSLATNPSPTRARSYPLNINPNPTRNPKVFRDPSGSGRVADLYNHPFKWHEKTLSDTLTNYN